MLSCQVLCMKIIDICTESPIISSVIRQTVGDRLLKGSTERSLYCISNIDYNSLPFAKNLRHTDSMNFFHSGCCVPKYKGSQYCWAFQRLSVHVLNLLHNGLPQVFRSGWGVRNGKRGRVQDHIALNSHRGRLTPYCGVPLWEKEKPIGLSSSMAWSPYR